MAQTSSSPEKFTLVNPYTLDVTRTDKETLSNAADYKMKAMSVLTRSFNFAARQVTTRTRDYIFQPGDYEYGGSSGVTSTLDISNFDDLGGTEEIALMHGKLVELGGTPPPLDEVLGSQSKPARPLAPGKSR